MTPKISVIVPVYNSAEHLRECLDSIVGQTLKEIEIICVDDGSGDASLEILKEYEAADSRVRVLSQANAGAGAARNRGLAQAMGEYLSFLDSDDFFEYDMIEKAYNKAEETKAQIIVFRADRYYEEENRFETIRWTLRDKELPPYRPMDFHTFTGNVFKIFVGWAWDKLFLRSFVEENNLRFQEIRTSNDMLFVFSAIVSAQRIEILDETLAHQRRGNLASLSNTREKSWNCFYKALIALKEFLESRDMYWLLEQDYVNYALHFSLWNYNTIEGEKKQELHDALCGEWFAELGIKGKPAEYFYDKNEYGQYENMAG